MKRAAVYVLIVASVAYLAWRGAAAFYWFRLWRQSVVDDPSAAELYQVNFWFELAFAAPGLVVALLAVMWLRRSGGREA